jgi:hypothetical protein
MSVFTLVGVVLIAPLSPPSLCFLEPPLPSVACAPVPLAANDHALAASDRVVYSASVDADTGERCEARGTVDAQPELRLRGVLYGISVTWDPEYRTGRYGSKGLRGPPTAPGEQQVEGHSSRSIETATLV